LGDERLAGGVMSRPNEPIKGTDGEEVHPTFGLIGASRQQRGAPGAILFDSDIRHHNTVTVTVYEAVRKRQLSHDRIYPKDGRGVLAEVEMSEAQWASFVLSMNTGFGVPCTIRRTAADWNIPGLPYEPRLAESMDEVRGAADRMLEQVRAAFVEVEAKPTKANIKTLKFAIQNAAPNATFVAESLNEHAENVVQRARADIEAMVLAKASQLGLDPADLADVAQLEAGQEEKGV